MQTGLFYMTFCREVISNLIVYRDGVFCVVPRTTVWVSLCVATALEE